MLKAYERENDNALDLYIIYSYINDNVRDVKVVDPQRFSRPN